MQPHAVHVAGRLTSTSSGPDVDGAAGALTIRLVKGARLTRGARPERRPAGGDAGVVFEGIETPGNDFDSMGSNGPIALGCSTTHQAKKKPAVAGLRAAPGGGREENGAAVGTLSVRANVKQG